MKSVRRTILGMLALVLVAAVAAGTYACYLWNKSDEMLCQLVRDKLAEIAPDWNVAFRGAHFDFQGRVHLYDVSLPGEFVDRPLLEAAEIVFVVDRATLVDPQPDIRRIRIVRPRTNLVRGADGAWNVERLPPLRHPQNVVPEICWEQGTIIMRLDDAPGGAATSLQVDDVSVHMVPAGKRQFLIKSSATVPGVDQLTIEGKWNLDARSWSVQGQARNLAIDRRVLQFAADCSSTFRSGLERLETVAGRFAGANPVALSAGKDRASPRRDVPAPPSKLEISAAVNVEFEYSPPQPESDAAYHVSLSVLRGELSHPAFAYPLRELRGGIVIDDGRIELSGLSAQSAETQITVEKGLVRRDGEFRPFEIDFVITDLPLDRRLYELLPAEKRLSWNSVQPTGRIDARMRVEHDGRDRCEHEGTVTLRDCTAAHVKFPFRVEQINGTVKCRRNQTDLSLTGKSAAQPIRLTGRIGKGPDAASLFRIEAEGLSIDEKLHAACPPRFQSVIEQLALRGEIDGMMELARPAGPGEGFTQFYDGRLRNGTIKLAAFPYPLSDVSGKFKGPANNWEFKDFRGRQGRTDLSWKGTFRPDTNDIPRLDVDLEARNADCDQTLKGALPPQWRETWNELNPQGILNIRNGHVTWYEGEPPQIRFDAELREGKLLLNSFRLPFDDVRADLNLGAGKVTIKSITGRYEETHFRAAGSADFPEEGEWHLHLADLHVDDLEPDKQFRKALPLRLKNVVDVFNPRGKLSISGMLDFRGKSGGEYPVTAAWNTTTVYTGNTITSGIDLKDMYGTAKFLGTWDGEELAGKGWIDLNSVKVFDNYQLAHVRGPISIDGAQLIVGSKDAFGRVDVRSIDNADRLTARFIDGVVGLDAIVELDDPMRYQTRVTLAGGELRRFAHSYMPQQRKLAGVMNGRIDLHGEGADPRRLSGTGRLQISQAALYDLPLIVAILQVLTFVPPKDAAFDQADFVFDIQRSTMSFKKIDLVGDAIHLVGQGTVTFKGDVDLDFASTVGRRQLAIPFVREFIQLGTHGLVGVKVWGPIQNPESRIQPFQQIDSALRQLLGIFEPKGAARR